MTGENKSNKYWDSVSQKITDISETTNKRDDMSEYDSEFVMKYASSDTSILDMGSGSGLVVNKISDLVKSIVAVETFEGFTKFIEKKQNVEIINIKLEEYTSLNIYDLSVMTGVSQFFSKEKIIEIYTNIYNMLGKDGKLVMRAHCGVLEDVFVNGYSEELQCDYFAEFRYIENEVDLLKNIGFKTVTYTDELPDHMNHWDNTRHFYIICSK